MTTKLKIDLSQGLLEVEGTEAFVRNIYADFKAHFAGIAPPEDKPAKRRPRRKKPEPAVTEQAKPEPKSLPDVSGADLEPTPAETPVQKSPTRSRTTTYTYTIIDDIELAGTKNYPSLVDFMDSKLPITNEEHNIVFLYYLQHLLKVKPITINHLYTCYRSAKIRAPLNIENTFDQRGWIKVAKNGNMTLTDAGKKYVEQSLPKKLKG